MQLVFYSLSVPDGGLGEAMRWQLESSIESLRAHDDHIPVHLLLYGALPPDTRSLLASCRVVVHELGEYGSFLRARYPRHAEALARYAPFHKWLNLELLDTPELRQLLFVDCDTYWFASPARLLEQYTERDWYAREEVYSRQSRLGYDPEHVDEDALAALAASTGARVVPPFNSGVVVMNHGVWRRLAALRDTYVRYTTALLPDAERALALPFPSQNRWITEQIALWLTLGHVPGLTHGFLDPAHALQGGEFILYTATDCPAVLCHYFGRLTEYFYLWCTGELELEGATGQA